MDFEIMKHMNLARHFCFIEKYEKMYEDLDLAIKYGSYRALIIKADYLIHYGQYTEALETLLMPSGELRVEQLILLGKCHLKLYNNDLVVEYLQRASDIFNSSDALYTLGLLLVTLNLIFLDNRYNSTI